MDVEFESVSGMMASNMDRREDRAQMCGRCSLNEITINQKQVANKKIPTSSSHFKVNWIKLTRK